MWYASDSSIKKDRPIFASKGNSNYVLLPQMKNNDDQLANDYRCIGYNWFNIGTGEYNSCKFYSTIEKAIEVYSTYRIFNGVLSVIG